MEVEALDLVVAVVDMGHQVAAAMVDTAPLLLPMEGTAAVHMAADMARHPRMEVPMEAALTVVATAVATHRQPTDSRRRTKAVAARAPILHIDVALAMLMATVAAPEMWASGYYGAWGGDCTDARLLDSVHRSGACGKGCFLFNDVVLVEAVALQLETNATSVMPRIFAKRQCQR